MKNQMMIIIIKLHQLKQIKKIYHLKFVLHHLVLYYVKKLLLNLVKWLIYIILKILIINL